MLKVDGVSKSYGSIRVLDQVSMAAAAGESVALVGESGSGKSTLLHLIAGLDAPEAGQITVDGRPVTGMGDAERAALRRDRIGIVFQQFNLIQSLSVRDNIAFQARLAGRGDADIVAHLAERLGLTETLDRYPEQVSGGQAQRIAIARALAARPPLLLADEPTGNLDEATGERVLDLFLDLVAEMGMTLLFVTHSHRLAARLGRKLTLHAGRLEA